MNWADLSMVNFHARSDGRWSWTAYRRPHVMWRSNYGLEDPIACLLELGAELKLSGSMTWQDVERKERQGWLEPVGPGRASGGTGKRPAEERKRTGPPASADSAASTSAGRVRVRSRTVRRRRK